MQSYEAIKKCVLGRTREIGRRLRISRPTLYMWGSQPPDDATERCGRPSPLDRLAGMIDESRALGASDADALAPVFFLARRYGYALHRVQPDDERAVDVMARSLPASIREFGEFVSVAGSALADGRLTPLEAAEVAREGSEAIERIAAVVARARRVMERRQPVRLKTPEPEPA